MNKTQSVLLVIFFVSLNLLLVSCSSAPPRPLNKQFVADDGGREFALNLERITELRQAFLGRTFIFKEDWYEYLIIDSDPLGGFSDFVPITRLQTWAASRNHRVKVASAGTVAKIVGMRSYRNQLAFICELETGGMAYIYILGHRSNTFLMGRHRTQSDQSRGEMEEDLITVPWVNYNLTHHTVKFIEDLPDVPDVDLALPEPPSQPTLTSTSSTASINQLLIKATPAQLSRNQQLNLLLRYTVDTAGQPSVSVKEIRTLLLNGKVLPNYPKTTSLLRNNGQHTSSFKLMVPARAKPGSYVFQAKVCIDGNCASNTSQFEIIQ